MQRRACAPRGALRRRLGVAAPRRKAASWELAGLKVSDFSSHLPSSCPQLPLILDSAGSFRASFCVRPGTGVSRCIYASPLPAHLNALSEHSGLGPKIDQRHFPQQKPWSKGQAAGVPTRSHRGRS